MIDKIASINKKIHFPFYTFPIVLFALTFIGFAIFITRLGFYWDDWAQILVGRLFGISGYWQYFASDRPFSAWTHSFLFPILGSIPLHWQILTLFLRCLTAILIFWTLQNIWNDHKLSAAFTSILFLIYPVFTQQHTSVAFHQHWLQYVFFFISIGCMVQAIKKPKLFWIFTLSSIVTLICHLSITEYFVGLELIRPLIIWIILSESSINSIKNKINFSFIYWLPYLIILTLFSIWRLFFISFPTGEDFNEPVILNQLFSQPIPTIQYVISFASIDTLYIVISSWAKYFNIENFQNPQRFTQISWLISILTAIGLSFYLIHLGENNTNNIEIKLNSQDQTNIRSRWLLQSLIIAVLAILLGTLPAWLTDRQIVLDVQSNRFALPALFGASLLWVVFIEWITPRVTQKSILICILAGIALSHHMQIANDYRWLWTDQTRFYWQLYWRAPYIEPGTAILSEEELFPDQGLFSTSSAINLLYPQANTDNGLSYWVYSLRPKFTYMTSKPEVIPFNTKFRTLSFSGKSPNIIMIYKDFQKGNCLWVLTPEDIDEPELSELTTEWLYLSNIDRIIDQSAPDYPPSDIFGEEPAHTWCYFFQKAELARQMKNWQRVVELGNEAQENGYQPDKSSSNTPHEWIPFIQGYALTGNYSRAKDLTLMVVEKHENSAPQLCRTWTSLAEQIKNDDDFIDSFDEILLQLSCKK